MNFSNGDEFFLEFLKRVEPQLYVYLPQDHHTCVPSIMAGLRRMEMDPKVKAAISGENYPDELFDAMVRDSAKNNAAMHLTQSLAAKKQAAPTTTDTLLLPGVSFRKREGENYTSYCLVFGPPGNWRRILEWWVKK